MSDGLRHVVVDDGVRIAYQVDGPADRPVVLFVHSLVIGGELDEATPPALAEDLHAAIVPSELMVIPGVAHLSNLEATALFNRRLLEHVSRP